MNRKNTLFCLLFTQCIHIISLHAAFPEWFKYFATASGGTLALEIIKSGPQLPILKNFISEDEQTTLNRQHTEQQLLLNNVQTLIHLRQLLANNHYFMKQSVFDQSKMYQLAQLVALKTRGIGSLQ